MSAVDEVFNSTIATFVQAVVLKNANGGSMLMSLNWESYCPWQNDESDGSDKSTTTSKNAGDSMMLRSVRMKGSCEKHFRVHGRS